MCAYNPANPPNLYFTIGDAAAALTVALVIPQIMTPTVKFRLRALSISLPIIYGVLFFGFLCAIIAALSPQIDYKPAPFLLYPVFWEILAGLAFLSALSCLARAFLWPVAVSERSVRRFAMAAADLLAHASRRDHIAFSSDLTASAATLAKIASFGEWRQSLSAFEEFTHRKQISRAFYADTILRLVSETELCRNLVVYCAWDVVRLLEIVSKEKVQARCLEAFIQEIGAQAILAEDSIFARETRYTGFRAAPEMSRALFQDDHIVRIYRPLAGLTLRISKGRLNEAYADRVGAAAKSVLQTLLKGRRQLATFDVHPVFDIYKSVCSQVAAQPGKSADLLHYTLGHSIGELIEEVHNHLRHLEEMGKIDNQYRSAPSKERDYLDYIADSIVEMLSSISFVSAKEEFTARGFCLQVIHSAFERFGSDAIGLNPLQQRLVVKISERVRENLNGWYPPLTRLLLSLIGAHSEIKISKPGTPYRVFAELFYRQLTTLGSLWDRDQKKARRLLPSYCEYHRERDTLAYTYASGNTIETLLPAIEMSIAPVFGAHARHVGEPRNTD